MFCSSRFDKIFVYVSVRLSNARPARQFLLCFQTTNMAANNPVIIISFKTAHEVFKKLDLAKKRQVNYGTNDFEIVEDILHHERVELINFSDENLDPERLVSF